MRKPGRKFYCSMTKFQGSGFSFQSLNQNIKVVVYDFKNSRYLVVFHSNFWIQFFKIVVFPSYFWNTIIWQVFRVILNFAQECYYLENKVRVVHFTKARGLGICKIYYSHFNFEVMYQCSVFSSATLFLKGSQLNFDFLSFNEF